MLRILILVSLLPACKTSGRSSVAASTVISAAETLDLSQYSASDPDFEKFRAELGPQYVKALSQLQELITSEERRLPEAHAKLAEAEKVAIYHYSAMGYRELNKVLRKADVEATAKQAGFIKVLSSALNKLPPYVGTVYRGGMLPAYGERDYFSPFHGQKTVDPRRLAAFKPGQVFVDKGFMSTSVHSPEGIRQAFGCREALYTISSKYGHDISSLAVISNELEVLFVPGSEFRINRVHNTFPPDNQCSNEVVELDVDEVQPGTYKPGAD